MSDSSTCTRASSTSVSAPSKDGCHCRQNTTANDPGVRETKIGSRILAIWKDLAKRRAKERHAQRQQARDAGMENLNATRILNTSIRQTLGDPCQWSAFVLEVVFTWWKLATIHLQRARLRKQRLLYQRNKQSDARAAGSFRRPLVVSNTVGAKYPGVVRTKNAQRGAYAGATSIRLRRRTPRLRKCCLHVLQDKNTPEPPSIRPDGKGVAFRTGKELRAGVSSADNRDNTGQGERVNIPVAMCSCSDREYQEYNEQNTRARAENRTPSIPTSKQFPSNHAAGEQGSGEAATSHYPRSPFVVGGPLCAEYPSYWTAAGISASSPLVAWATAEKRQQVSTSGSVPSEGGYTWRGLSTPPLRSKSANHPRRRHRYPPAEIVEGTGCFPSCVGVLHHTKLMLKRTVFSDVSQDFPGRMRASTAPGRSSPYNTVDRGVGRRPLIPHRALLETGDENRCVGRYLVLV